jgi:hypothetical protein
MLMHELENRLCEAVILGAFFSLLTDLLFTVVEYGVESNELVLDT